MLFRPSESSKKIADFYRRYLLTTFRTNNSKYNEQLKSELEKQKIIADGPYVSMVDPYEKGKNLVDLVQEGIVSKEILKLTQFHPTRQLYKHQEIAIRKAITGKNLIVTTGTGSGKTESFLIPVINQLLCEKEAGTLNPGVRTLIIYPMNALVNDQIRRLRDLLSDLDGENQITFGRFTGETRESYKDALAKYEELEDISVNPLRKNEIISREQMRETPPNILITNYAMLEYMLLRPGDNIIFSEQNASKWQYIVLDEAHSYSGAKGIEVSALIRRVKAMLNRNDIRFILTSATLGNEKLDKEIIQFGTALCSASFDKESIIRSKTVEAKAEYDLSAIPFELYRDLAALIKENMSDEEQVNCIKKYGVQTDASKDLAEQLFSLVLHDPFYYKVRKEMHGQIKTLQEIAKSLVVKENDLTDFIAVTSNALRNGERLFEAKYHMFLRGIEGIYVTLHPSDRLFINKMETFKANPHDVEDIGYKAYEISFCSNCSALYITGKEEEGYLVQHERFYDDYNPDIFLLSGDFDEDEEKDADTENIFQICAKCGAIKHATSVNGLQCGHGSENFNRLIRVKKEGEVLHTCPCCHSISGRQSILRPYFLGSEASTSVIATALYNELPGKIRRVKKEKIEDEFFGSFEKEEEEIETIDKQFLTFSDNRQMAAFFASYLGGTYQDALMKRVMYWVMDNNREEFKAGISVTYFAELLSKKAEELGIFFDMQEDEIRKKIWIQILKEISNYKAKNSLLQKGNIFFDTEINLPKTNKVPLTRDETIDLFKNLCRNLMRDAAIKTPVDDKFMKSDIEEYAIAGISKSYNKISTGTTYIVGWCPEEGKTNKRLKYLTKIFEGKEDLARRFLEAIWNKLEKDNIVQACTVKIKNGETKTVYKLSSDKIKVKSIEKMFQCPECKAVTPYNIKNICENPKCSGQLQEFYPCEQFKEDHYYQLYRKLELTPLVAKEHTAQLSSEKAYEYQRQFKDKRINVLSCSTTFEMGVDVGSLETVFMRNMPPSPANYAQRAGRAGRSLKSAAYALTFCPNSSHDLNYFRNPVTMIRGSIKPPLFNVSNDKIVLRHIFASAFSYFWRTNPEKYKKTIGEFMEVEGFEVLKKYLDKKPEELKKYLERIVPADLRDLFAIDSFGWVKLLFGDESERSGYCNIVKDKYLEDIKDLNESKNRLISENKNGVDRITRTIKTIQDQRLIDFLSRNNLIPKYGFPVDTVELQGASMYTDLNLRLNRDLFTAISEYAPESEIVADNRLLKSRYVRKLIGYEWPMYNYMVCPDCLTLNKENYLHAVKECRQCGKKHQGRVKQYIIPKFGFVLDTEGPRPVGFNKPERTYKGSISYIGEESQIDFSEYMVCGQRVMVGNQKMDSLAVLNESPFFVCETCGYGVVDKKTTDYILEKKHKNSNGYNCMNKILKKFTLGHEFQTNVAIVKFIDCNIDKKEQAWTILYSLLEGLSRYMSIDRNELSGCLQWYCDDNHANGNFGFVIFDNTPGGAGYVRQLKETDVFENMMREGFRVVKSCSCGKEAADTACYSCLCNYYNQRQHELLKRKYAIEFYQQFMDNPDDAKTIVEEIALHGNDEKQKEERTKNYYKVVLCNEGYDQVGETDQEIWENLSGDCEGDEKELIEKIRQRKKGNISKPIYRETVFIEEFSEKITVDQIWPDKKVMLFLAESKESFEKARKTGWHCYCTADMFDVDEFLSRIEV